MPSPRATGHPTQVLFVLLLAGVSFALSQTLVVPALPQISREFSTGASSASWVLTGFLLSASVATPIVGKLGDLYGMGACSPWCSSCSRSAASCARSPARSASASAPIR